jgi:hypothetical protein
LVVVPAVRVRGAKHRKIIVADGDLDVVDALIE